MTDPSNDESLLSDLADEFTRRLRQGECPPIEEFVQRFPQLAIDIRQMFPTLMLMESQQGLSSKSSVGQSNYSLELKSEYLGDYRILREVGRGGMGMVYEAIHEALGRRVALKVLPQQHLADARNRERFQREARAAARLQHNNIVPVYDVGEIDGVHFYTMQFIDGYPLNSPLDDQGRSMTLPPLDNSNERAAQRSASVTLADTHSAIVVSGSRPLDANVTKQDTSRQSTQPTPQTGIEPDKPAASGVSRPSPSGLSSAILGGSGKSRCQQIARLGKQIANALAYAHGEGVIHRDIKPDNLLLDAHGVVWITDFGLAQVAGQEELTSPGDVVGTLRYMPPERFEGHVGPRGDIYSLGVTLYEMLTKNPVFAASTRARLIDQILNAVPIAPRYIDRSIPRNLETIVLKAMARDPSHRYPNADALAEDLGRFLSDRPILARRPTAWEHTWRWCRRKKALASMIALAAVLCIAIFSLSLADSVKIRNQLQQTLLARRETRERLFDALVSQAHARWMGGSKSGRRFETLDVVREASQLARELNLSDEAFARMRNEAIGALCIPDAKYAKLIDAFPLGTKVVDFDPDFEHYARGAIDGNVTIHRASDNRLLHRLPTSGPDFELSHLDGVAFSLDGIYLKHRCVNRLNQKSHLRWWDLSGTEPRLAFELVERVGPKTEFAPDGRHVGVVVHHSPSASDETDTPTRVHVFDLISGRDLAPPLTGNENTRIAFHPTHSQLAYSDATTVRIVEWQTGKELALWNRAAAQPMAWSPDGSQLLARSVDERNPMIYRWDARRQRELPPLEPPERRYPDSIAFRHRGDLFVSTPAFSLNMWEFRTGQLLWTEVEGCIPETKFSRDDQLLGGFVGRMPTVRVYSVADGLELRRFPLESPLENGFACAVISPDGRILAATSQRGTVLLDLQTFEELAVIPGKRLLSMFEPDGSILTHAILPEGMARWPIHVDEQAVDRISIGTPQSLTEIMREGDTEPSLFAGVESWEASVDGKAWTASEDGRVIATPWQKDFTKTGANIFIAEGDDKTRYRRVELGPQHNVYYTSVSPDGKYVATGSVSWLAKKEQAPVSVTVWDTTTGQRIKDLLDAEGVPQFSGDGKWIAVTSGSLPGAVRVWRVGSWQPAPAPDPVKDLGRGQVAFDAGSQLMAVQGYQIRLIVPASGREVARLSIPEETSLAPQCFTPDGTRLIAFGVNGQLYVWDLKAIRRQLAELGLDWNDSPSRARH